MSFTSNCPNCRTKLVPIFYGKLDYIHLDLHVAGRAFLGGMNEKPYHSYCALCEESFNLYTDIPNI
jgi:hypothetical protein